MFQVLSPTYTIRIEIQDRLNPPTNNQMQVIAMTGPDGSRTKVQQFFDGQRGKTGCDEALAAVQDALSKAGITNFTVSLERFEHK